ncbi:hypothetical protein D3C72_1036990 [compost metagenome]
MKDLIVDLYTAPKHAQLCMKELGITYQLAVPQSMGDCWWFFNCENVPAELPEYLRERDFGDLNTLVGFGLSQKNADDLIAAKATSISN